jgi:quercetin dioxygenase-like cupin family protein
VKPNRRGTLRPNRPAVNPDRIAERRAQNLPDLEVRSNQTRSHPTSVTPMGDTTITRVSSVHSPKGPAGQKYLASGKNAAMRLWENEPPGDQKPPTRRDYETVGYVIRGRAESLLEGQMVRLEPGDSWVAPKGSEHTYRILESFTAVEATYPPAQVHGRDEN